MKLVFPLLVAWLAARVSCLSCQRSFPLGRRRSLLPQSRRIHRGLQHRQTPRAMFLEEVELRPAAAWAKDQPKNRVLASVFALYNSEEVCVYVGTSKDSVNLVKGLLTKYGEETVHRLRCEAFMSEDIDEGMMNMLQTAWLDDVTRNQGGTVPVGNADDSWVILPETMEGEAAADDSEAREPSKFAALTEELAGSGDKNAALFAAMNAAMAKGDQEETARIMSQIAAASASMPEDGTGEP